MKLVNLKTQQYEDVPDDQVQQAFQSGTHGFASPDDQVGMRAEDGSLYKVAAKDAATAFQQGAQVVPHAEIRQAELEEKYGGIGGTAVAGAEGVARGLSVGISDPLAIGVGGLVGGKKGAEAVRTHLAEEKEAHPYIAGAGEIGGAILPTLASGGAAAPLEGANLARAGVGLAEAGAEGVRALSGAERFAGLLRAVGAPARGVAGAGEGAASLAERTLSLVMKTPGAEGALARVTRQAVTSGARGAAEGALFGAGQEISEDALGDHELNAEKLMSALGHGALYGGMLGGGLGAAGVVARESFAAVLNRVAPSLERQADVQMWKALSPLKRFTNEAEARAGGADAVGRTLREELDLGGNPLKAALTPEELAPKIDEAVDRKWQQMSQLMKATGGDVEAGKIVDAVDDVIAPLRKKAGFEGVVSSLEQYKTSLAQKLGLEVSDDAIADAHFAQARANGRVNAPPVDEGFVQKKLAGSMGEDYEFRNVPISDIGGVQKPWSEEKLGAIRGRMGREPMEPVTLMRDDAGRLKLNDGIHRLNVAKEMGYTHIPALVEKGAQEGLDEQMFRVSDAFDAMRAKRVPVTDVMAQRKALDELVYKETRALDPGMRVEALRAVRGKLADLELEAFDSAAKAAGKEGVGEELRGMRKSYQRLRIAQDAVNDTSSRMATNRNLSLTDMMAGSAHAAGALAAGHPLMALAGVGTSFVHKAIRERGNAAAAVALGRLAKLDLIARATQHVDAELDGAVKAFVRGSDAPAPRIRLRHFGSQPTADLDERYKKAEGAAPVQPQPITPAHVEKALPGIMQHAPKTGAALAKTVQAAAAYKAAARPQPTTAPSIMGEPARVPQLAQAEYLRKSAAVDDPVGTLTRGLESGKLHKDEVDAVQAAAPKVLAQTQQALLAEVAKHGKHMSYEKKITASRVTGVPLDPTLTGPFVKAMQATYAPGAGMGGPVGMPQQGHAPKRQLKGVASQVGLSVGRTSGL